MELNKEEFKSIFTKNFIKTIKSSIVPYTNPIDKEAIVEELYTMLTSNSYSPSSPRDYIVLNKSNSVSRITVTFEPKDFFLYYFTVKSLESKIAKNRVEGTFGGWTLGNGMKEKEDLEVLFEDLNNQSIDEISSEASTPQNSYNPFKWKEQLMEFNKYAYDYKHKDNANFVIKFDIANFYDSINLNLLYNKLNQNLESYEKECLNVLMVFLKNWNKPIDNEYERTVGLPQEELSDCSRILANYYLQDYDAEIYKLCQTNKAYYLRYADDQLIFANDEYTAKKILFEASKILYRYNLNINASKVHCFNSNQKYNDYWSFDFFKLLENPNDRENIEKAIRLFLQYENEGREFKKFSVLKKLYNCDLNIIDVALRSKIIGQILEKEFLSQMNEWALKKIYKLLNDKEKEGMLRSLNELIENVQFNSFHYNLMRFYEKNEITFNKEALLNKINSIKIF